MEALWVAGGVAALAIAFGIGYGVHRWWALALPFVLPVWLAAMGVVGYFTEDRDDCYEACGYAWMFAFAIAGLVLAIVLAAAIALGVAVRRRRDDAGGARGASAAGAAR